MFKTSSGQPPSIKTGKLFTLASDWKVSAYLQRKFADAEVVRWGVVEGQLCVVVKVYEDIF